MLTLRGALAVCLALLAASPACAAASAPVGLAMRFGDDARLGAAASVSLALHVDSSLPPVTEFRLLTPASLSLSASRLGAASCHWPASEIARVMGPVSHRVCPPNSLIATGSATAGLQLSPDETIFGAGLIELHAGASVDDKPGLLVTVNTYNPIRVQLTYAGYLYVPPAPFGVGMAIRVPLIPKPPFGAPVALSHLQLAIGRDTITYYRHVGGRRVAYHPGGIPLPDACPRGGFRFRVVLRFADGARRTADAVVACPPSPRRGRPAR
jgi:hypothetical protein